MSAAQAFLAALSPLDGPRMIERSMKVTAERVIDGRLLVSAPRRALLPGAKRTFTRICEALGAPDITPLAAHLPRAAEVHFGFQPAGDAAAPIYKAYLEFAEDMPVEALRFMALKWSGNRIARTLYLDRTDLSGPARADLIAEVVPRGPVREVLSDLMHHAARVAPLTELPLLLVEEEGSARRSVDLNLADLEMLAEDAADIIAPLFPDGQLSAQLRGHRIGHIAAGTDGSGVPFATIYYGARPMLGHTARL